VIVDARLDDLQGTVAVGRGYSVATNTIYSSCVDNGRNAADTSYDTDFQLRGLESSEDIDALDRDGEAFVRAELRHIARHGRPLQAMVAILTVRARIRPVDESEQKFPDNLMRLLEQGRLSAFVSICGSHYVRALRRRSSLYVLFTYEAPTADRGFESDFHAALSGFDLDEADSHDEAAEAAAVTAAAAARNLRIVNWAIGLSAQPGGEVAFDMGSYRRMVDHAFQASQHDRAGVPYEMEVIPWLSHPAVAATVLARSGSDGDLYATRQIITETADHYLELSAKVAGVRAAVSTAVRCHEKLYRTAVVDGRVRPDLATVYVQGQRAETRRILPLTALVAALSPAAIATVQAQADAYALTTVDGYCLPELIPALPSTRAGG
jgi:hypothetical protein